MKSVPVRYCTALHCLNLSSFRLCLCTYVSEHTFLTYSHTQSHADFAYGMPRKKRKYLLHSFPFYFYFLLFLLKNFSERCCWRRIFLWREWKREECKQDLMERANSSHPFVYNFCCCTWKKNIFLRFITTTPSADIWQNCSRNVCVFESCWMLMMGTRLNGVQCSFVCLVNYCCLLWNYDVDLKYSTFFEGRDICDSFSKLTSKLWERYWQEISYLSYLTNPSNRVEPTKI